MTADSARGSGVGGALAAVVPEDPHTVSLLATSLVVTGLTLGSAYGGPVAPFALLAAFLAGGVFRRQTRYLRTRAVYGNAILALFAGALLGVAVVGTFVSLALDVGFLAVASAVALRLVTNAALVVVVAFLGFVAAVALGWADAGDRTAAFALSLGVVGFVAVQYRLGLLWPNTSMLYSPMLSQSFYARYRVYQLLGVVAAGVALLGLVALLDSRRRVRLALGGLVLTALVLGGAGVGAVDSRIEHAKAVETVSERTSVDVTAVRVAEQSLELTVRVRNPTDRTLLVEGAYVRASNATDARLAYGSGRPRAAAWPLRVPTGATRDVTLTVPLTADQRHALWSARVAGPVDLDVRLSARLPDGGLVRAEGFVVRADCRLAGGTVSCRG